MTLQNDEARAAKRKWVAEQPSGWTKNVLWIRQFGQPGFHRLRAESELVCIALNL